MRHEPSINCQGKVPRLVTNFIIILNHIRLYISKIVENKILIVL